MDDLVAEIERAKNGDVAAYGGVVRRFQSMAYGCAYAVLNDFHLAEDVAQEAFIEAYRTLSDLREPKAFSGWFRRIALGRCNRVTRKQRLETVPLDAAAGVSTPVNALDVAHYSQERRRPVLVGVATIAECEQIAQLLRDRLAIEPQVLNARPERALLEGDIVAAAGTRRASQDGGEEGTVTAATAMAGRGTDITVAQQTICVDCIVPERSSLLRLGVEPQEDFPVGSVKCCLCCDEYDEEEGRSRCFKPKQVATYPAKGRTECRNEVPCGLHVIGVGHATRRTDAQLRARAGRQGSPGSSRFFVSAEPPAGRSAPSTHMAPSTYRG